jgi:hypothetical protein
MLIVQINKAIMLWSVPGACHWAYSAASWEILASSEAPHQAQLPVLGVIHSTKYSGHHCHSFCCCLIYGSCRFPWNPNDWFLIGRDHVVWCMPQRNHMPCVYFSRVVDFALGVLTWAMSHIYDQRCVEPFFWLMCTGLFIPQAYLFDTRWCSAMICR